MTSFAKLAFAPSWQRAQVCARLAPLTGERASVFDRMVWALGWSTPFASGTAVPWQSAQEGARPDPTATRRPWIESLKVPTTSCCRPAASMKAGSSWQAWQRSEMARAPGVNLTSPLAGAVTGLVISWTTPWHFAQVGPATLASFFIHAPWIEAASCSVTSAWQLPQAR